MRREALEARIEDLNKLIDKTSDSKSEHYFKGKRDGFKEVLIHVDGGVRKKTKPELRVVK